MSRAKVYYRVLLDGSIKIEKWEGVLTINEISKTSVAIATRYVNTKPYMWNDLDVRLLFIVSEKGDQFAEKIIHVGEVLSKEEFGELIELMKTCGRRLVEAITYVRKEEAQPIKCIEI